jgi:Trk K+ transport system NAD-binding subunit
MAEQEINRDAGEVGSGAVAAPAAAGDPGAHPTPANGQPIAGHAVIAGYGLPGRAVAEALREAGVAFCVIERNADTVRRCLRGGVRIIAGDATDERVLREAGVDRAWLFAATMPNDQAVIDAVARARRINGALRIIARCEYMSNGLKATRKGADDVVVGERVVADAFKQLVDAQRPATARASEASARAVRP